jgi:iron complex outermembrane receptor protein
VGNTEGKSQILSLLERTCVKHSSTQARLAFVMFFLLRRKIMKLSKLSAAILIALTSTSTLAEKGSAVLDEIFISDNLIISDNLKTPYSTESYSRKDIQDSGSNSLSDFLNQKTTLLVQPNYGNPLAPKLDMNGYGTNGGENIQVIVDGVSINNIDMAPQQLSSIALDSIEEISILRGAGSVLYGNGATAGAIVITTNKGFSSKDISKISTSYGSNATSQQSIALRKTVKENGLEFLGAFNAETLHSQGSKKINSDGTQNSIDNTNTSGTFGIKKQDSSAIFSISENDSAVNYPGTMDVEDFNTDPDANLTSGSAEQTYNVVTKKMVLSIPISDSTQIKYSLNNIEKSSVYFSPDYNFTNSTDYSTTEHKLDLKTILDAIVFQYGLNKTNSDTTSTTTYDTSKKSRDEIAGYISANYDYNSKILVNAGYRKQFFEYSNNSKGNDDLNAYNLGLNVLMDDKSSVYANLNHAFLVPNFDRLFPLTGYPSAPKFNPDIKPQESDTYTLGYKLQKKDLTAKAEVFYIDLTNEIYYKTLPSPDFGLNTNLEDSHKKGVNLSFQKQLHQLSYGLGYNYVDARIDKGVYKGNTLPAAPKHTLKVNAQYDFVNALFSSLPNHQISLSHKQTSESFMMDDFDNIGSKAPGYKSTDMSYKLSNKQLSIQLGVDNIFEEANGLYIYRSSGNKVYATNYERYYYLSATYQF